MNVVPPFKVGTLIWITNNFQIFIFMLGPAREQSERTTRNFSVFYSFYVSKKHFILTKLP